MSTVSPNFIGQKIPSMTLKVDGGKDLSLPADFMNQWTLIYFYPKDDTPGCTRQSCGYRDHLSQFTDLGIKVYGISLDDLTSHQAFRDKFSLNFPLIYDQDKHLSVFLKVYGEQEWQGKKYMGLSRDSFLIGPDGCVRKEWRKVNPDQTIEETLAAARELIS